MTEEKSKCTGCGACVMLCDQNAISLKPDSEGFNYPIVDQRLCVACGKCKASCGIQPTIPAKIGIAFRNADCELLNKSASGGAFGAIVKAFWEKNPNGIVYGAVLDDKQRVCHKPARRENGMDMFHGSKYVQSELSDSYRDMAKHISDGAPILFSGTPCQCSAVRTLFGNHGGLLIVDTVCNGVGSPAAFRKYLDGLRAARKSEVKSYHFRNKRYEMGRGISCSFEDGTVLENTHGKDRFCRMYMMNMISRPSCYTCPFASPDRNSDITIGDFHGLEAVDPEFYKDGTSLVIPHTELGMLYSDMILEQGEHKAYPIEQCLQPRLQAPAKSHMLRRFILKDYLSVPDSVFEIKYGKMV